MLASCSRLLISLVVLFVRGACGIADCWRGDGFFFLGEVVAVCYLVGLCGLWFYGWWVNCFAAPLRSDSAKLYFSDPSAQSKRVNWVWRELI